MTQEEFIKELEGEGYSYKIEGDNVVVTHEEGVNLRSLETLPPEVKFENKGYVDLDSLETLPPGVVFNNKGDVFLNSLTSIPSGVEFRNESRYIDLDSLTGGWFSAWNGNIEGIESKRLLNKMIADGVFDRR